MRFDFRTILTVAWLALCLVLGFMAGSRAFADDRPPSFELYASDAASRASAPAPRAAGARRLPRLAPLPPRRPPARMLRGVSPRLAAKAREIVAACGSCVVSGLRHTRIAGARSWSLHASGLAVDLTGNPACIYAHLRGWPGGYSVDYARVRHVHVSGPGGREDGARFVHHVPRRHARFAGI